MRPAPSSLRGGIELAEPLIAVCVSDWRGCKSGCNADQPSRQPRRPPGVLPGENETHGPSEDGEHQDANAGERDHDGAGRNRCPEAGVAAGGVKRATA